MKMESNQTINIRLEKKITDGLISFLAINLMIWIIASELHVFFRIFLMFLFSAITIPFNYKKMSFYEQTAVYELPILNISKTVNYDDFISVNFDKFYNSLRAEYMNLEIKYSYQKRKKNITIPISNEPTAIELCKLFMNKNIEIKTNDSLLQSIINKAKTK